ncbi:hypothetical protein NQ318_016704 [Aromia moschata]|uniref:Uncharacterized protein n=1 Tax=Aromia moschata TaxID=1265417 RepID=A0AAV8XPG5_9CUCU|nr:hypothetical protein NQ318_016704 [Aromia moschata]
MKLIGNVTHLPGMKLVVHPPPPYPLPVLLQLLQGLETQTLILLEGPVQLSPASLQLQFRAHVLVHLHVTNLSNSEGAGAERVMIGSSLLQWPPKMCTNT